MSKPRPKPAQPKLADFLCFSVYSANLAFGRAYKPILDALGLTYTQWIILVALSEENDQTVKRLGEKLFLESNTLTPILKKLEELGYVRRERDRQDERQVVISLTDAGRSLRDNASTQSLAEATALDPEQFDQLRKAVSQLRDNLLDHARDRG